MSDRGAEFKRTVRNQVGIVVRYCERLLDDVPADSPLRPDLLEMQKAAVTAMDMLRPIDPRNP